MASETPVDLRSRAPSEGSARLRRFRKPRARELFPGFLCRCRDRLVDSGIFLVMPPEFFECTGEIRLIQTVRAKLPPGFGAARWTSSRTRASSFVVLGTQNGRRAAGSTQWGKLLDDGRKDSPVPGWKLAIRVRRIALLRPRRRPGGSTPTTPCPARASSPQRAPAAPTSRIRCPEARIEIPRQDGGLSRRTRGPSASSDRRSLSAFIVPAADAICLRLLIQSLMLYVTPTIVIPDPSWTNGSSTASGPEAQNVDKVVAAVGAALPRLFASSPAGRREGPARRARGQEDDPPMRVLLIEREHAPRPAPRPRSAPVRRGLAGE